MGSKLQNLDIRIILIVLLISVSTGHVGKLFADREAKEQAAIGYVLALAIDGVLAISLYELAGTTGKHKWTALGVFLAACSVSGGFNVSYYRVYHPSDPFGTSLLLGLTAPGLAAALAVLKSMGDVEKARADALDREAERQAQFDLQKLEIEQREETKRLAEVEKTKRAREKTRQEQAKAEAKAEQRAAIARQSLEEQRQKLATLGKSLEILRLIAANPGRSQEEIGRIVGRSRRTVGHHMAKLEKAGAISRNGDEVEILWNVAVILEESIAEGE